MLKEEVWETATSVTWSFYFWKGGNKQKKKKTRSDAVDRWKWLKRCRKQSDAVVQDLPDSFMRSGTFWNDRWSSESPIHVIPQTRLPPLKRLCVADYCGFATGYQQRIIFPNKPPDPVQQQDGRMKRHKEDEAALCGVHWLKWAKLIFMLLLSIMLKC